MTSSVKSSLKRHLNEGDEDNTKRRKVIFKDELELESVNEIEHRNAVKAREMMSDLTHQKFSKIKKSHPNIDIDEILQNVYHKKKSTSYTNYPQMVVADFRDFIKKEFIKHYQLATDEKVIIRMFSLQFARDITRVLTDEWTSVSMGLQTLVDISLSEL